MCNGLCILKDPTIFEKLCNECELDMLNGKESEVEEQ